jgi:hypothetical protein
MTSTLHPPSIIHRTVAQGCATLCNFNTSREIFSALQVGGTSATGPDRGSPQPQRRSGAKLHLSFVAQITNPTPLGFGVSNHPKFWLAFVSLQPIPLSKCKS